MKRVEQLAIDISHFLMDKSREETCGHPPPFSEFEYATAIVRWEARNKPNADYFTIHKDQDKFFLHFRRELSLKFGLPVLTSEEAQGRQGILKVVTSTDWLKESGIINPFEE